MLFYRCSNVNELSCAHVLRPSTWPCMIADAPEASCNHATGYPLNTFGLPFCDATRFSKSHRGNFVYSSLGLGRDRTMPNVARG